MCSNWSALIVGDYETIMPLPWRKKFGIRYFYAPPFIQQLGLIGNQALISFPELKNLLTTFAYYGDLFWNDENESLKDSFGGISKTNFILDLNHTNEFISALYSNDLQQNLVKASKYDLLTQSSTDIHKAILWYSQQYGERFTRVSEQDYINFENNCIELSKTNNCFIRETIDPISKESLAIALLLKDNKRIYLILNAISNQGRKKSANHFLIANIIHEFSEQKLLFDFEGSSLEGVSDFYQNFHPINKPYFHYHHNQLPAPLKWLFQLIQKK
jgi:hypothetical protein